MWCFCGLPGMLFAVCVCVCVCVCVSEKASVPIKYDILCTGIPIDNWIFFCSSSNLSASSTETSLCVFLCVRARTCALAPLKASIHQFFSWYTDYRRSNTVYTTCSCLCCTITETNPDRSLCNVLLVCPMMNSNIQWPKHKYATCNRYGSAIIVVMHPSKRGSCLKGNIGWWTGCGLCAHASTLEQNTNLETRRQVSGLEALLWDHNYAL